jgi:hypothetical protein
LEEIDRAGSLWQENGLVFASETGMPLDRRDVTSRRFKPLLKRAGLPLFRFHDLRHTCATLLLTRNVNPKVASEMLGHSSIAITPDTFPRAPQHARQRGPRPRRSLPLTGCITVAVNDPGVCTGAFLRELHSFAKFAGVLVVPEVGLEPTRCSRTTGF